MSYMLEQFIQVNNDSNPKLLNIDDRKKKRDVKINTMTKSIE